MDGQRITGVKFNGGQFLKGYQTSTQSGIYIVEREMLKKPIILLSIFKGNKIYRYATKGTWTDYGNPDNVIKARETN